MTNQVTVFLRQEQLKDKILEKISRQPISCFPKTKKIYMQLIALANNIGIRFPSQKEHGLESSFSRYINDFKKGMLFVTRNNLYFGGNNKVWWPEKNKKVSVFNMMETLKGNLV